MEFAVIDVETTGLDPDTSRMIECAIIHLDANANVTSEWSTLIDVPGDDPLSAAWIHGIDRTMLRGAPTFSDIAGAVSFQLAGRVLVGHVLAFDLSHLRSEYLRAGMDRTPIDSAGICTRDLVRANLELRSRSLLSCCEALGISVEGAHSALGDARATAKLFEHFLSRGKVASLEQLRVSAIRCWLPSPLGESPVQTRESVLSQQQLLSPN